MSKLVLILDEPQICPECLLFKAGECTLQDEDTNTHFFGDYEGLKICCPLRPLPERKIGSLDRRRPDGPTLKAWIKGWNDCLQEVEGGKKNDYR